MKIHIVQKGDTLWKIAKKYGVNFEELKTMNAQLSNPDMIMPGMKIKVPTSGGTIKKEVAGAKKEAPINFGAKKEMPKVEHPFKEEKPKTVPVTEKPITKPKPKPYTPKMPQPVIPEIDINNYYMMNMANVQSKPKEQPKMPPKPKNILPKPKEEKAELPKQKPIKESVKEVQHQEEESLELPTQPQGGFTQPMFYNPNNCVPVSPVMPGPGYGAPYGGMPGAGFGPGYGMGMPGGGYGAPGGFPGQVQGASTFPGMNQGLPGFEHHGKMHGMGYDDESSSFMPYMHQMPMHGAGPSEVMGAYGQQPMGYPSNVMGAQSQQPMGYPTDVMGAQSQPPMGYPTDVMGAYGQNPMGQPQGVMGVQDEAGGYPTVQMPQDPFNENCYPVSPVMPGPGFHGMNPYGGPPGAVQGVQSMPGGYGMPGGYPGGHMPGQVQGAMMDESSMMHHGYMPEADCGCGGPKAVSPTAQMPIGQYPMGQPPMGQPYGPGMMGQGMPAGPGGYHGGGQGMFGPRAFGMPQANDDDVE